jgi:hypothetical protein
MRDFAPVSKKCISQANFFTSKYQIKKDPQDTGVKTKFVHVYRLPSKPYSTTIQLLHLISTIVHYSTYCI